MSPDTVLAETMANHELRTAEANYDRHRLLQRVRELEQTLGAQTTMMHKQGLHIQELEHQLEDARKEVCRQTLERAALCIMSRFGHTKNGPKAAALVRQMAAEKT